MSQTPPTWPTYADGTPRGYLKPHRGGVILALGIIGLVCCMPCGIVAWVMGNSDLRDMSAGVMDESGRGTTQAGKICGMISVILAAVGLVIWVLLMALGVFAAGVSSVG